MPLSYIQKCPHLVNLNENRCGACVRVLVDVRVLCTQNCPHLVNLNEDPLMTECLVYFLAPGRTVVGSDVSDEDGKGGNQHTISLVGQTIAPHHCAFDNSDGHVYMEAIMGAVTFVNGRRIAERTLLRQGNRIMIGSSHIFRFNDPMEAARVRKEREEYLKAHPNESLTTPAVIDWTYAIDELRAINAQDGNGSAASSSSSLTPSSASRTSSASLGTTASTATTLAASEAAAEGARESCREEAAVKEATSPPRGARKSSPKFRVPPPPRDLGMPPAVDGRAGSSEDEEDEDGELEALGGSEEDEESDEDEMVELEALDNPDISNETLAATRAAVKSPPFSPIGGPLMDGGKKMDGLNLSLEGLGGKVQALRELAAIGVLVQRLGGLITVVDLVEVKS